MSHLSRREFIASTPVLAVAGLALPAGAVQPGAGVPKDHPVRAGDGHRGVVSVASGNGLRCVKRATELMAGGYDPADCVVQAVRIIEDDPEDMSVGYGGLPNEEGVVELDASVMHGPTHKSGAVAGVRNIKNVAMVALEVLRKTNHCLIVGDGARRFAVQMGYPEENLLTEKARQQWLKWKSNLGTGDFWLGESERDEPVGKVWDEKKQAAMREMAQMYTTGTVHCSVVTGKGDIASCTTTSGLSWKIPGRIGDSPIIGAGNYCDNDVGAAGCTGRGESAIVNLSAFSMVDMMSRGMTPNEACMEAARRMWKNSKEKRLKGPDGKPTFGISFYALRKDGAWGGACLTPGGTMSVSDSAGARVVELPALLG